MLIPGLERLDEEARGLLAAEVARHRIARAALRGTRGVDAAAELNRHLDRVGEILRGDAQRRHPKPD